MTDENDPYGLGSDIPDDKIAAALAAMEDSRHGMDADCLKEPLYEEFSKKIADWRLDPNNPQSPTLSEDIQKALNDGIRAIVSGLEAASIPSINENKAEIVQKKTAPVLALENKLLSTEQLKNYPINRRQVAQRLAHETAKVAISIAQSMGVSLAAISEDELNFTRAAMAR